LKGGIMPFVDFIPEGEDLSATGVGGKVIYSDFVPEPKPRQHEVKLVENITEEVDVDELVKEEEKKVKRTKK